MPNHNVKNKIMKYVDTHITLSYFLLKLKFENEYNCRYLLYNFAFFPDLSC
jgi:hypothetical protein